MKKISKSEKRKHNNIIRSRKAIRLLKRKNKKKRRRKTNYSNIASKRKSKRYRVVAPSFFSISRNRDTTLNFFSELLSTIENCGFEDQIFFNLADVNTVTVDAIMYVIAILQNYKRIKLWRIQIVGNLPSNINARNMFEDVGFYNYVIGPAETRKKSSKSIRIMDGSNPNGKLAAELCEFVNGNFGKRKNTKRLYTMLVELMTNTVQHAYNERVSKQKMYSDWYVFAEYRINGQAHFVFLDTGSGIPNTIKYKLLERGKNLFKRDDATYIESVLKGEFRTETGMKYRGKGLPGIYNETMTGQVSNLVIISGYGECNIIDTGQVIKYNLSTEFNGTLFEWNYIIGEDK